MPITTNNSLPLDLSGGAENNRTGGAAGVEIPVIVHASRYSASGSSVGKSLPPVHEETRTVIVFDQGAVVRLSAPMTAGEVVVLTNKLTSADVICKVVNVKAQPGIQNYVSLEFTQRAPGFWGASTPSGSAPAVQAAPAVVAQPLLTRPAADPAPPPKPASVVPLPSEPVAVRPPVAPADSYQPEPAASVLAEPIASAPAGSAFVPPAGKAFGASSTLGLGHSGAIPSSLRPVEFAAPSRGGSTGGKNIALIAVAAVVLLALGGVGGWLLLRPSKSAPLAAQAAHAPETPAAEPAAENQAEASAETAVVPALADTPAATSNTNNRPEAPAIQPAVAKSLSEPAAAGSSSAFAAAQPAPTKSAAPVAAVAPPSASRRAAIDVTKMAAPSVKEVARSTSGEAPPEVSAPSGTIAGNPLNDNLLASSARNTGPAAPPPLVPSRNSQLLPPKLLSAPPPTYPQGARSERTQGDVTVDAFIDETGKVAATKIISGSPQLQQAAMNAVRSWKYQPARLDGQPISIHVRVTVSFRLQ